MKLYNSLTNQKEEFLPIQDTIKMYACGPTVYDNIHIGNARSLVVFDLLYRILKHKFQKVIYVRNITDIDDKIINNSLSQNTDIKIFTEKNTLSFHQDMQELNNLIPDYEPRATDYLKEMTEMIEILLNKKIAYISNNHVYFSVEKYKRYGQLSNRTISSYKKDDKLNVNDFVLWKCTEDVKWPSPWGDGRPGWHIECSAMIKALLGDEIDIHCGGRDLLFPHHENEIAQTCSISDKEYMARYWVHSGLLLKEGGKMSKSIGNIQTVKGIQNKNALRLALLFSHYRQNMPWSAQNIHVSEKIINKFTKFIGEKDTLKEIFDDDAYGALLDDMNTPLFISKLHKLAQTPSYENKCKLYTMCNFIGLLI